MDRKPFVSCRTRYCLSYFMVQETIFTTGCYALSIIWWGKLYTFQIRVGSGSPTHYSYSRFVQLGSNIIFLTCSIKLRNTWKEKNCNFICRLMSWTFFVRLRNFLTWVGIGRRIVHQFIFTVLTCGRIILSVVYMTSATFSWGPCIIRFLKPMLQHFRQKVRALITLHGDWYVREYFSYFIIWGSNTVHLLPRIVPDRMVLQ